MIIHNISNHDWMVESAGFRRRVSHGIIVPIDNAHILFVDPDQPFAFIPPSRSTESFHIQNLPIATTKRHRSPEKSSHHTRMILLLASALLGTWFSASLSHEAEAPVPLPAQMTILQHNHFLYVMEKQASTPPNTIEISATKAPQKSTQKISTRTPHKLGKKSKNQKQKDNEYSDDFRKFLPQEVP